jgi:hypothetical protein
MAKLEAAKFRRGCCADRVYKHLLKFSYLLTRVFHVLFEASPPFPRVFSADDDSG